MSDPNQNKDGATLAWYGVSFVAVMSACAVLVFLLQSLGFTVDGLWIAVFVGSLFHTGMSLEGLRSSSVGIAYSTDNEAIRRKVVLLAGAFGGLSDIVVLLLIIFVWQRLGVGPVVGFILFISGFLLPPALGVIVGFYLAKKIISLPTR